MNPIKNNIKGFTLVELLVVVSIIAILGAVAVSGYIGITLKATRSEAYANLEALRTLEEQFFAENANYAPSATCLAITIRADGTCFTPATVFTGFKPGAGRSFDYVITQNVDINGAAQTPCFSATATGIAGSRVAGDVFAIDCNNNRTF